MLQDLKMSLKDPSGDFVDQGGIDPTSATRKMDLDEYENVSNRKSSNKDTGKKEGKFKRFIKNHKKLSIFIGLILLFLIAFGGTLGILNLTNPAEVQLPNLVGMSREEAQADAEEAKLKFEVSSEEYNTEVPEGFVISQDPKYIENYNVKEGSTVKVVVSKGTEKATVPNVEGKEESEAIKLIEDAKLKAEVIEETSQTVEEGHVISQETDPDTEVSAGDTVKIHVSTGTGIKQVKVQNVVGQTEANAKATLEGQGLKVNVSYVDSTNNNGIVARQSVAEGTTVNEGTTVTLTVNKIAETKTIAVNINVKEITGGYEKETNTASNSSSTSSTTSKTVNIKVNNETRTGVDKNNSNYTITLSGKDGEAVSITVTITDPATNQTIYSSTQNATYGNQTSVTFQ